MRKKITKMTKTTLSLALAAAMVMGLSGMTAFAEDQYMESAEEVEEEIADTQTILVEELVNGMADISFDYHIYQITDAEKPIETMDDILDSVAGSNLDYVIYDAASGEELATETTDSDGGFSLSAKEYAEFVVAAETDWYVFQDTPDEYPLADEDGVTAEGDHASVVDNTNGVVQYEAEEEPTAGVDKSELEAEIGKAEALDENDYTVESWEVLEEALAAAEKVLADSDATQEEIDQALADLQEALDGLEKADSESAQTVDKSKLQEAYNEYALLQDKKSDYTPDSWDVFEAALEKAQEVINDESVTLEAVDEALEGLEKAREDLTEKAEMTALQEAYDEAVTLEEADYTPETWAPFAGAREQAKEVLDDENATQEVVDAALKGLQDAREALEEAESETETGEPTVSVTVSSDLPDNETTYNGESITLTAEAEGSEGTTLSYQWYLYDEGTGEFAAIEGATGSTYTLAGGVSSSGTYRCTVTAKDENGNEASASAAITIRIEKANQDISYAEQLLEKTTKAEDFTNELTVTALYAEEGAGITYTSSNLAVATVDENTGWVSVQGVGSATITATASETENYAETTASYTITVMREVAEGAWENVRYAVKIYGIMSDTYLDENGTMRTAGLTFGPVTGENLLNDYDAHLTKEEYDAGDGYCIHWMTWDEIIAQSEKNPDVFAQCRAAGCTKAVELTPNETLFNLDAVNNALDQDYTGDGVGTLYYLLNGCGKYDGTSLGAAGPDDVGAVFNRRIYMTHLHLGNNYDPADFYSRSRIRTTLTGDQKSIIEWMDYYNSDRSDRSDGAGDWYGVDTLYDETNCLLSCFPEELQDAVVARTTLNTGNAIRGDSLGDETTYDKLFLFSLREMGTVNARDDSGGDDYGVNLDTQQVYEFSGTDATDAAPCGVWTRSRFCVDIPITQTITYCFTAFAYNNLGVATQMYTSTMEGLSPGFSLPGPETPVVQAFAVYSEDDGSLTFYKTDDVPEAGTTYRGKTATDVYTGLENTGTTAPGWYSKRQDIQSVTIDASFEDAYPMSMYEWFYGISQPSEITGLEYINTSQVMTMNNLFYGCTRLTSVDGAKEWDTSRVTDMYQVFGKCGRLTDVDALAEWDTARVTNMRYMFDDCYSLTDVDALAEWDTAKVEDMRYMFRNCSKLEGLDLSGWDTTAVVNYSYFATGCSALEWVKIGTDTDIFTKGRLVDQPNWYDSPTNGTRVSSNYLRDVTTPGQYWSYTA